MKYTVKIGKSWLSIDKTGIVIWLQPTHRNYYFIWSK